MRQLEYEKVTIREELAYRIGKNYSRLENVEYRPETIFSMDQSGWPADWEGRTLLAWVLLARVTKRYPAYLDGVKEEIKKVRNKKQYFREIFPKGQASEQQLSGHNWYLRALLEEYLWKKDPETKKAADAVVENLYLPVRGMYKNYPVSSEYRSFNGEAAGHTEGPAVNGWFLSTDIGCAFMSLDALSQYYEMFHDERVAALLDEMIESLTKIDFVACRMQTHASLSAARGILRYYRCTKREELLSFVIRFFALYKKDGMTENYANYNWFGRPEWTEPCAIVDSYLLAAELFMVTKESCYARDASRIFYNGLGFAQRENGGFGCDLCAGGGEKPDILMAHPNLYEAYWCCSMRGAEGLSKAAVQSVMRKSDGFVFLNYVSLCYEEEAIAFAMTGKYPLEGHVKIQISRLRQPMDMEFYIPEGTQMERIKISLNGTTLPFDRTDAFVKVKIEETGELTLDFPIEIRQGTTVNARLENRYRTLWHGDLLLGIKEAKGENGNPEIPEKTEDFLSLGNGRYEIPEHGILEPINGTIYTPREDLMTMQYRILYHK